MEKREGRGPCYLKTAGISRKQEEDLYKAYLNMAPLQSFQWVDSGFGPSKQDVEIEGSEPYVVGGHTASGYWVDREWKTTLEGLFAAGDVAGGAPQKYVTGALAEGLLSAKGIQNYLARQEREQEPQSLQNQAEEKKAEYESHLNKTTQVIYTPYELETAMQKAMEEYAGGIRSDYRYNARGLGRAKERIDRLRELLASAKAADIEELLALYEVRDRLVVSQVLLAHLAARKETRWHGFQENTDYPKKDPDYECYINSVMRDGEVQILKRELVKVREQEWESS
ncbi:MAG: adenylylsulfate reductase, partial [Lachnospiraceae bacterium]|nr:adenylylsulfate reductase [Lachnospiraceae bacterium]